MYEQGIYRFRLCLKTFSYGVQLARYWIRIIAGTADEYCRQDFAKEKSLGANTVNDELKKHHRVNLRHRSFSNFIANSLSASRGILLFEKPARH